MLKIFNAIFTKTWVLQNKVIEYNSFLHSRKGRKIYKILFLVVCCFILLTVIAVKQNPGICKNILFLIYEDIISALFFYFSCSYDFIKTLTSLRFFLIYGFILSFVLILLILSFFTIADAQFQWLIIFVFFFVWCGLSIVANSTVAITANTILAGLISIIMLIVNTFIAMIPTQYPPLPNYVKYMFGTKVIYTFQQKAQIDFNTVMIPPLLINGTAAILAALKSYWVKKYNDGKEISWQDFTKHSTKQE